MPKVKTTRKAIKEAYPYIIKVGYCNLQFLLDPWDPAYYCTRAEGWACDIYTFGDVAISTGYAPFGNVSVSYDIQKEFEFQAEKICSETHMLQERREKMYPLLKRFIKTAIEGR